MADAGAQGARFVESYADERRLGRFDFLGAPRFNGGVENGGVLGERLSLSKPGEVDQKARLEGASASASRGS